MNRKLLWAILVIGLALVVAPLFGGWTRTRVAAHRAHPTPA